MLKSPYRLNTSSNNVCLKAIFFLCWKMLFKNFPFSWKNITWQNKNWYLWRKHVKNPKKQAKRRKKHDKNKAVVHILLLFLVLTSLFAFLTSKIWGSHILAELVYYATSALTLLVLKLKLHILQTVFFHRLFIIWLKYILH